MRIVLVHGFTQTAASWAPYVQWWREGLNEPCPLDVPDGLDFVATASALGDAGGPATYMGYSMGGRLCLQLALDRPELVERLVLISASPGIADPAARASRREADELLAQRVEREGVRDFVEWWVSQPMFASLPRDVAGTDARIEGNTPARIAHQLRALGQGAQPSNWERLEHISMPVALFVGSSDTKYVAIAQEMAQPMRANMRVLAGLGHACHLPQPHHVAQLVASWLDSL
jgi:2-succinyl-6-hydroxy-2,4-cyclohexadiene-1-carboxylate synthase